MKGYGTSKKLTINLGSQRSISQAIQLLAHGGDVNKNVSAFMEKFVEAGVAKAKELVPKDTGELESGIHGVHTSSKNSHHGEIVCEAPHAAFVEFGVGVKGQGTYPALGQMVYAYNMPSPYKDATGGWTYFNERYGRFVYTHGNVAKPFMYNTAVYLRDNAMRMAEEIMT